MVVVHLDLDLVAGVAGRAFMGRIGIAWVRPAPDLDGNVARRAVQPFGRRLGLIGDTGDAVIGSNGAIGPAGDGIAGSLTGSLLDGDPRLEEAAEVDDAEDEEQEHHSDEGELHERRSPLRAGRDRSLVESLSCHRVPSQHLRLSISGVVPTPYLIRRKPTRRAILANMFGRSDAAAASK
jgi:hypothetical protein